MSKTFQCEIVSAEQEIFSGHVEMLIATGSLGELGILPGHSPLLTGLKPGPVRLYLPKDGEASADGAGTIQIGGEGEHIEEIFYASGGFIEVQPGVVTILADTVLRADDVDEDAAKITQEKAQKALGGDRTGDFNFGIAAAQLAQAAAQLRTLERFRNRKRRG